MMIKENLGDFENFVRYIMAHVEKEDIEKA
jgi:hypothetical protein